MNLISKFQVKRYSRSGSQDFKITQHWSCHDLDISGPVGQSLVMSRSWQFPDQKFELKMDVSMANDQKRWSNFGHVTFS